MRITLAIAICISVLSAPIAAQQKTPLRLVQTINLPGVHGRMDHMDVDVQGKRLFVAALESGSVEIVDLARASWHKSIGGFLKPQGVLYVEPLKKLFVASGDDGMVRVFNGKSLQLLSSIQLEKGSNRVTYDPLRKLLYVGSGGKDAGQNFGRVAVIDAKSHKIVGNVKVTAHPAELLLDSTGDRLFVFIPIPSQIQVVDARTLQVISTWPVTNERPGDGAYDAVFRRLLVGTRKPAEMVAIDAETGKQVSNLATVEGMDGVYFDPVGKIAYVSGGRGMEDGSVFAYKQVDGDHYESIGSVRTRPGAGTCFWSPQLKRLYVAAPATPTEPAAILVFEPTH